MAPNRPSHARSLQDASNTLYYYSDLAGHLAHGSENDKRLHQQEELCWLQVEFKLLLHYFSRSLTKFTKVKGFTKVYCSTRVYKKRPLVKECHC